MCFLLAGMRARMAALGITTAIASAAGGVRRPLQPGRSRRLRDLLKEE
jgi:hypothetical protein